MQFIRFIQFVKSDSTSNKHLHPIFSALSSFKSSYYRFLIITRTVILIIVIITAITIIIAIIIITIIVIAVSLMI